jgi:hypothetical protein
MCSARKKASSMFLIGYTHLFIITTESENILLWMAKLHSNIGRRGLS